MPQSLSRQKEAASPHNRYHVYGEPISGSKYAGFTPGKNGVQHYG
jgi:hypothetical protein